jgi:hypothetical protein
VLHALSISAFFVWSPYRIRKHRHKLNNDGLFKSVTQWS